MNPEKFALVVGIVVFVAGSLGLALHRSVPEKHLTGGSKDMIGAVAGLLTLLSALVLGLLIWTAYGVYAGQNTAIQTLAAKALQFDLALKDYGPDASAARTQLREGLAKSIDQVWGTSESDTNFAATNFAAAIQSQRHWEALLKGLNPSTDAQKQALASATSVIDAINQSRLQMSFALSNPVSIPLLAIVVAWATILIFGYGLLSGGNVASVVALAVAALAVASAAYLIVSLSDPYAGLFRASSAPLDQVLAVMGKE
jgi:hypothetical protein